jgi:hypothetical protein
MKRARSLRQMALAPALAPALALALAPALALALAPTLALALAVAGCGEVERVSLAITPSPEDYNTEIHQQLLQIGCSSEGFCHDIGQGGLTITVGMGAADLEESYLSVKAQLDFEDPAQSRLIQSVLTQNTQTTHFPPDCISVDNCTHQKLIAWIAWTGEGDARPQDVDCDPTPEGCGR